jgi:hypothetical protein
MKLPDKKVKRFEYLAKHDGLWFDVCSLNKKNRTIRLYDKNGIFETSLDNIEELITEEEFYSR